MAMREADILRAAGYPPDSLPTIGDPYNQSREDDILRVQTQTEPEVGDRPGRAIARAVVTAIGGSYRTRAALPQTPMEIREGISQRVAPDLVDDENFAVTMGRALIEAHNPFEKQNITESA